MTFVFWIVIDCLLRSKFVGYTANFTENSDIINFRVEIFLEQDIASTASAQVMQNKVLVGAIPRYFDPFVDNEVDLVVVDGKQELAPAPSKSAEVHLNKLIGGTTVDFDPSADINVGLDVDDDQELEAPLG
jgi:hypothetical protein